LIALSESPDPAPVFGTGSFFSPRFRLFMFLCIPASRFQFIVQCKCDAASFRCFPSMSRKKRFLFFSYFLFCLHFFPAFRLFFSSFRLNSSQFYKFTKEF